MHQLFSRTGYRHPIICRVWTIRKFRIWLSLALITSFNLFASSLLFDDFSDGNLAIPQWRNNNTNTGTTTGSWSVITDPVDAANLVLQSGPDQRTHSINVNGIATTDRTLTVSFRFNASQAGQSWNTRIAFLQSTWNSGSEAGCGYGIRFGSGSTNNIQIQRLDGFSSSTTLIQGTGLLLSEWNKVSFSWSPNGTLTAALNDHEILTTTDSTHTSKFARLYITNFLNNIVPSDTGKVLLYDDFQVTAGSTLTTFQDAFEDAELETPLWRNNNTNTGTNVGSWSVTTDPQLSSNLVLMSSPTSRTHSINADCENQTFAEITASLRFNPQDAGTIWNTRFAFLLSDANSGDESGQGYAVKINSGSTNNLELWRLNNFSSATLLAQGTTSRETEWNTVTLAWRSGTLVASLNSGPQLVAHDSTLPLKVSRLYITNFLNNITPDDMGKVIYYDDIQVEMSTGSVPFSQPPAVGVHPRILISPDDLPELRHRLNTTPSGIQAKSKINSWLNNAIHSSTKPLYDAYQGLISGNTNAMSLAANSWWADQMPLTLGLEAFYLQIEPNAARSADLADALETFIQIEPMSLYLAYAYDFAYDNLGTSLQDTMRNLISQATYGIDPFGTNLAPHQVTYNWIPHDMKLLLMSLAIEGETGYDASIYTKSLDLMQSFLQYGIYESGTPREGMHYYHYGMSNGAPAMAAMAKRGDDLFALPHYQTNRLWYAHSIEPFGYTFSTHHDTVDDKGGLAPNYILKKWTTPEDPIFDYVWRNRIGDGSNTISYRGDFLTYALFSSDWDGADESPQPELDPQSKGLPNSYYCPKRGLLITRSAWDLDALALHFECRPEVYGPSHSHSDRNGFTLSALGRKWVIDRGFHVSESKDHASVLIDGVGQGHFGPKGEVVDYADSDGLTMIAGDASYAYQYRYTFGTRLNNLENQGFNWELELLPEVIAHYSDTQDPNDEPWLTNGTYTYKAEYNPVQYAFRTAALARGSNPYVLIADNIRKDNASHTYQWLLPVEDDLVVESATSDSLTLVAESATSQSPRLLIKVLSASGLQALNLETYTVETSSEIMTYENFGTGKRVVISSTTVEPDFRIVLLPLAAGDTVPAFANPSTDVYTVQWSSQTDTWTFTPTGTGRDTIGFSRQ